METPPNKFNLSFSPQGILHAGKEKRMFQRVLVPLDGSKRAERAIPVAANLVRVARGTITLARIIDLPAKEKEDATSEDNERQGPLFVEAKAYLETLLNLYEQELAGLHLVLEAIPGTVPSSLFDLADQEHLDLIVMCSRGESGLKRWVLGSMTQATFRRSPLPVLALNERGADHRHFQVTRPLRILVPYDGSEFAQVALPPLFQLLESVSPTVEHEIHLLQVIAMPTIGYGLGGGAYIPDNFWEKEREKAKQELQEFVQLLAHKKPPTLRCTFKMSVVVSPDVTGTILRLAQPSTHGGEGADYDLIAMATHGRTGLKRLLWGSVTEHVFGATSLPLLVVRPASAQFQAKRTDPEQSWVGLL
jgi:nucleotide-binding universal stress UspA family protein